MAKKPPARPAFPDTTFRHILVPTDLTSRTERALTMAIALAATGEPRLTLLHVIQTIPELSAKELEPFYRRLEKRAQDKMRALLERIGARAVDATPATVRGQRAEEIVTFAVEQQVDLIVLASHTVNPSMANRDWGTISYKVGILAPCPVLLVK